MSQLLVHQGILVISCSSSLTSRDLIQGLSCSKTLSFVLTFALLSLLNHSIESLFPFSPQESLRRKKIVKVLTLLTRNLAIEIYPVLRGTSTPNTMKLMSISWNSMIKIWSVKSFVNFFKQ